MIRSLFQLFIVGAWIMHSHITGGIIQLDIVILGLLMLNIAMNRSLRHTERRFHRYLEKVNRE